MHTFPRALEAVPFVFALAAVAAGCAPEGAEEAVDSSTAAATSSVVVAKVIGATPTRADMPIANLFDGCLEGTPDCSAGSETTDTLGVELDLGGAYALTEVRLFGDANGEMVTRSFDVEVKSEGAASYTKVVDAKSAFTNDWTSAAVTATARYVRVTIRGTAGSKKVHARELAVLGAPAPTPPTNPTPPTEPTGGTPFDGLAPTKLLYVSPNGSDGNPGTQASPKRTLAAAVGAATAGTAIMMKAGTYVENLVIRSSGTATAPIWIRSADGAGTARIARTSGGREPLRLHGAKNWVIEGLTLDGGMAIYPESSTLDPKSAASASNVVVRKNIIVNGWEDGVKAGQSNGLYILDNDISKTASEQGIDFVGIVDSVVARNKIHDITASSTKADGINVKGGSKNVTIEDNVITNVLGNGISAGQSSTESLITAEGQAQDYEAKALIVRRNKISSVGKRDIIVMGCDGCVLEKNDLAATKKPTDVSLVVSDGQHSPGWNTRNTSIRDNCVYRASWLDVGSGQGAGLVQTNNTATACK